MPSMKEDHRVDRRRFTSELLAAGRRLLRLLKPGPRSTRLAGMTTAPGSRRLLLVCSPGGHLLQLDALGPAYEDFERSWVTLEGADVGGLLDGERYELAHGPTNRSLTKAMRNLGLAWRLVRRERPDAMLSTGAALAVPFFLVGRLHGCRCVYVESLTRTETLSLAGRLVYPLAHDFFVQWPDARVGRRARYQGGLL